MNTLAATLVLAVLGALPATAPTIATERPAAFGPHPVLMIRPDSSSRSAPDQDAPSQGVWPLAPRPEVVRGFDPPDTRWGAGHRGVDLLGRPGQPVRAAADGTITFAGTLAGRGVVVVDSGATRTTYEPVSATVQVGDHVAAGAVIGTLQLATSHCFPRACLHWGLLRDETYLNPLTLVGGGPVRLLPMG